MKNNKPLIKKHIMSSMHQFFNAVLNHKLIEYLKKHYKIYFIFISIFILFKSLIESQFEYLVINPLLSKAEEKGIILLVLFIIISVWLISHYRTKYKNKYIYSENSFFISVVLLFFYIHYRLDNQWLFYPLPFIPFLKILDLLAILAILNISGYLFQKKRELKIDESKRFLFDNPITISDRDSFNRKEVAETIVHKIVNTVSDKSSFTIGIQSEWGYGKTSFLNIIVEKVEELNRENVKIIHYNPWLSYEKDTLIQSFFDVIIAELKSQNSNLSNNISLYSKALTNIEDDSIFSKIAKSIFNLCFPKPTIADLFKQINDSIVDSKIQLIIVIDDIDRLNKEEIVEIIRLVRNVANFANTTFIVAYDKSYVINALRENSIFNPEKYLEKIFQYEHVLSPINMERIKERVFEKILEICKKNADNSTDYNETEENLNNIFDDSFNSIGFEGKHFFWNYLKTFRDVSRYINQLDISYLHLYQEIDLCDLLNLEILRTKYPLVCFYFFKNDTDEFLTTDLINNKHCLVLKKSKIGESKIEGFPIEKFEYDIKTQMLLNPSKYGINQEDINEVLNMLNLLFPDNSSSSLYHNKSNQKSINNIIRYTVYANYVLPSHMLPEKIFERAVSSEVAQLYKSIDNWIESYDLLQIHSKFLSITEFVDKNHYEKIIKAIFYYARKIYGGVYNYDNNDLLKKMNYDYYSLSKIYGSKKELEGFVISVFKEAESPYFFDIQLLRHAHYHSVSFIINDDKNNELRLWFLEKHLKENHPITKTTWYLYQWCDIKSGFHSDSANRESEERNPKAKKLIINYIKNGHIDDFILASIEKWTEGENVKYAVFNSFVELFGEFKDFETFLEQFDSEKSNYIDEYRMFMNEYKGIKEKYPKGSVEFTFEKIPIGEREY